MTATTTLSPPESSASFGITNGKVTIQTSELVPGRRLQFPLYNQAGVLLLAEGSVITPRFKSLLQQREIDNLQATPADADELTRPSPEDLANCAEDLDALCATHELTQKLDTLISGGDLFVKNSGHAVSKRVVLHGCKGYDAKRREKLTERHAASAKALDGMMHYTLQGGKAGADKITSLAGTYLTAMTEDMDLIKSIAAEAGNDASLSQHCLKVSLMAMAIGVEMGLDADNVQTVGICGLVHDWGMLKVPERIRMAPRRLSSAEFTAIQKHPIYALELLENLNGIPGTIPLVCYQVHERLNGSGYPRQRSGRQIHPFARLIHVADAYVSLTSPRPYRPALMPHAALDALLTFSAEGYVDPECVQKLLFALSLFPIGSLTELSDGSVAQTIRRNGNKYNEPIVRIIRDAAGEKVEKESAQSVIDLSETDLRIVRALPFPGRNEVEMTDEIFDLIRR